MSWSDLPGALNQFCCFSLSSSLLEKSPHAKNLESSPAVQAAMDRGPTRPQWSPSLCSSTGNADLHRWKGESRWGIILGLCYKGMAGSWRVWRHLGIGRVEHLSSYVYTSILCNFRNTFPVCDVCGIDMYLWFERIFTSVCLEWDGYPFSKKTVCHDREWKQ